MSVGVNQWQRADLARSIVVNGRRAATNDHADLMLLVYRFRPSPIPETETIVHAALSHSGTVCTVNSPEPPLSLPLREPLYKAAGT